MVCRFICFTLQNYKKRMDFAICSLHFLQKKCDYTLFSSIIPHFCTKKGTAKGSSLNCNTPRGCLQGDSTTGANICTCATLGAHIRINRILLALRDSTHRTFVNTRTASDTIIRNFVSHKSIYLFGNLFIFSFAVQRYNKKLTLPNFRDIFLLFSFFFRLSTTFSF